VALGKVQAAFARVGVARHLLLWAKVIFRRHFRVLTKIPTRAGFKWLLQSFFGRKIEGNLEGLCC
jgi:hypothetical protein